MKIYPYLRLLWIALAGSALLNLTALSDFMPLLLVANVLNLACFGLIAYVLYYYMYWGLDERVISCGYAFPARRIRWCLYAPLLGAFIASFLLLAGMLAICVLIQLVCQFVPVVLIWQYMKAVREREENPLTF